MFNFRGPLLFSKSWLNRFLIINEQAEGDLKNNQVEAWVKTASLDVQHMAASLKKLRGLNFLDQAAQKNIFDIGEGGTTLRFFTFLASKKPGDWILKCDPRLLERPQQELKDILSQLQVDVELSREQIVIRSQGWKLPSRMRLEATVSSQFASGLLLSCWNLENDFELELLKPVISEDYFRMTVDLMEQAGLKCEVEEGRLVLRVKIPKGQKPKTVSMQPEIDVSSAFSLAACAVVNGTAEITNWNNHSRQPDFIFVDVLQRMGIQSTVSGNTLKIERQKKWKGIELDLSSSPDLFPVLSCLCALAEGRSRLYGAEHLKSKESDRIDKTHELLLHLGIRCQAQEDGIAIDGAGSRPNTAYTTLAKEIQFNPDHDHRMAMAAAVMKLAGYKIQILTPHVVSKSYPDFWQDIGLRR